MSNHDPCSDSNSYVKRTRRAIDTSICLPHLAPSTAASRNGFTTVASEAEEPTL